MSGRSSKQPALSHSRGKSHWNETVVSRNGGLTGCSHAFRKRYLAGRPTTLATEERLKWSHARLSVWEKDMRQIQAQEAVSDARTENETETAPRRQRTLSNEAARRRQLLAARMSSEAAARGMNLLQLGAHGPQTRQNYAASLLRFER